MTAGDGEEEARKKEFPQKNRLLTEKESDK